MSRRLGRRSPPVSDSSFVVELGDYAVSLDGRDWQFRLFRSVRSEARHLITPTLAASATGALSLSPDHQSASNVALSASAGIDPSVRSASQQRRLPTEEGERADAGMGLSPGIGDKASALIWLPVARLLVETMSLVTILRVAGLAKRLCHKRLPWEVGLSLRSAIQGSSARNIIKAACLEESLALLIACLVRGYEATWCIGVRFPPFDAHAWVEVEGVPVGEYEAFIASMTRIVVV